MRIMTPSGLLVLCDGAISHNRPQIASDRTIRGYVPRGLWTDVFACRAIS